MITDAVSPSAEDALLAGESSRQLSRLMGGRKSRKAFNVRIQPEDSPEETVSIPLSAFILLNDILIQMAQGNAITLIPIHAELTTQQAADILNVSRPFLVEQLDRNIIPHRKVGKHRRILFKDVMEYKKLTDSKRLEALKQLTAQAEELDMGY
jgi:excisionase family DNA binding protein